MDKQKMFFAVLAGAVTGAAVGMLFAPEQGWGTRKKLSLKAKKLAEEMKLKSAEALNTLSLLTSSFPGTGDKTNGLKQHT